MMMGTTFGDMARFFAGQRQTTTVKTRLYTLAAEMSSGRKSDLTQALGGDQRRFIDSERQVALSDHYQTATAEADVLLRAMQVALTGVEGARDRLASATFGIVNEHMPDQLDTMGDTARQSFQAMVSALNARAGGIALFSGAATDRAALARADDMLAAVTATAAGSTTAQDVITAVDAWFDTPGGGFETLGYQGDTGTTMTRQIDAGLHIDIDLRADDPGLRALLKAAALGAMADQATLGLSDASRADLLRETGLRVMAGADGLVGAQARVGRSEQIVAEVASRHSARSAAFAMLVNDLSSADPYETATALQQAETQLQTHYTVTARLANLSLVGFLR
jgi:flagellar hook-associated protein 3 FlgL